MQNRQNKTKRQKWQQESVQQRTFTIEKEVRAEIDKPGMEDHFKMQPKGLERFCIEAFSVELVIAEAAADVGQQQGHGKQRGSKQSCHELDLLTQVDLLLAQFDQCQ